MKKLLSIYIIIVVFFSTMILFNSSCGCGCHEPELYSSKVELLDIKRDDDAEYHLMVKFSNGEIESYHDVFKCDIYTGNYKPTAIVTFFDECRCSYKNDGKENYKYKVNAFEWSFDDKGRIPIKVYLPNDYKIEFIND